MASPAIREIRRLNNAIDAKEVSDVAYKFNSASSGNTDVRIPAEGGNTVLIRSSDMTSLECDWQTLLAILAERKAKPSEDNAKDKPKAKVVQLLHKKRDSYFSYKDIVDSPLCRLLPNGHVVLLDEAARLLHALDREFLQLAQQEQAHDFYAEPFWEQEDLQGFGYQASDKNLCGVNHLGSDDKQFWQIAVCDNIWKSLSNSCIEEGTCYTSKGTCCRHEGRQEFLLERMKSFSMREVVCAGKQDSVMEFRNRSMHFVNKLCERFELDAYYEEANDPFFLESDSEQDKSLNIQVPEIVKFELRLNIYNDRSLSAASFNVHGNFFAQKLDIQHAEGKADVWTSCSAFGIERWVWAILSQHGVDPKKWPKGILALLQGY